MCFRLRLPKVHSSKGCHCIDSLCNRILDLFLHCSGELQVSRGTRNIMAQSRSPQKTKRVLTAAMHVANLTASSSSSTRRQQLECYSESSDDDEVRQPRKKRYNPKIPKSDFVARMNKLWETSPRKFRTRFRMGKESLDKLMEIVGEHYCFQFFFFYYDRIFNAGPHFSIGQSTNQRNVQPREKVMAFLRSGSGNEFQRHASDYCSMSQSALCNAIDECVDVLYEHLVPLYNVLPTEEEGKMEAEELNFRSGFPAIGWGCIDGTHIVVSSFLMTPYLYHPCMLLLHKNTNYFTFTNTVFENHQKCLIGIFRPTLQNGLVMSNYDTYITSFTMF